MTYTLAYKTRAVVKHQLNIIAGRILTTRERLKWCKAFIMDVPVLQGPSRMSPDICKPRQYEIALCALYGVPYRVDEQMLDQINCWRIGSRWDRTKVNGCLHNVHLQLYCVGEGNSTLRQTCYVCLVRYFMHPTQNLETGSKLL